MNESGYNICSVCDIVMTYWLICLSSWSVCKCLTVIASVQLTVFFTRALPDDIFLNPRWLPCHARMGRTRSRGSWADCRRHGKVGASLMTPVYLLGTYRRAENVFATFALSVRCYFHTRKKWSCNNCHLYHFLNARVSSLQENNFTSIQCIHYETQLLEHCL